MENVIIIKLFRNQIAEKSYRAFAVSTYPQIIAEMNDFAQSHGKKLYFTLSTSEIVQTTPICEIEYTCPLTQKELDFFVEKVKYLSSEGEIFSANKILYTKQETTLCLIKLSQIAKESLIELSPQEKLPTKIEKLN